MTRLRCAPLLIVAIALAVPAAAAAFDDPPDRAAVTSKTSTADDNPRAAWLDRYQDSRQGPEQTERFTHTARLGAEGALDLENISGDVRVTAGRGNEIQIEAIKRVRHRNADEGRRLLGQLRVEVAQVGNRLQVRTIYPRVSGRGLSASVDYTITVPVNGAVAVKAISGDVSVSGVGGEVRAETVSGNVQITSTPNLALAKSISGDVIARDISAAATLTLTTVSGTVIASGLKVRTLDAGTVSGNIQLTNLQVERLQAKCVSGDIEFDAVLARGGRYEFNSHSGNVRIMLSSATGFELDASTFSGSIRSDFPVTLRSTSDTSDRRRGGPNRAIRGTFGDASAILSVRSFSGNVVITKK